MVADILTFPRRSKTERKVIQIEEARAWRATRELAGRMSLAAKADRPDLALAFGGQIVGIADRRLRQLNGGSNDAA